MNPGERFSPRWPGAGGQFLKAMKGNIRVRLSPGLKEMMKRQLKCTDEDIERVIRHGITDAEDVFDAILATQQKALTPPPEMTMLPEFQGFPKIPRLKGRTETVITEKIDGTNAHILITQEDQILAGSRHRWLLPGQSDNVGFRAWVEEHHDELLQLGPGHHFGEWWGQKIQRTYGLDHRKFSLFNVRRWTTVGGCTEGFKKPRCQAPACCDVVPILDIQLGFNTLRIQGSLDLLGTTGSSAAPGFMRPEGVVVYHTAGKCMFKLTLDGDQPKGTTNG